ncbi:MAG: glucosaminidase domain-containing protein, partial [Tannerellaceae bacterium]|nr:glucosaminidase domain-containing protein [Tannerellaceae bacterium]
MKIIIAIVYIFSSFASAPIVDETQAKTPTYENYIRKYGALAIAQQKKYHVPASITLAQGLLESGAGQSELARKSNNHFGIKCHTGWYGDKVYYDDNEKDECFRKYKNVEDSFEDHSIFLTGRSRYANLFKLSPKDYRGWAKGLQESGYATDQAYANRLIKLIEDYELYHYDSGSMASASNDMPVKEKAKKEKKASFVIKIPVFNTGGLKYIMARDSDSFESVAEDTGLTSEDLKKFNEVPDDFPLQKGDIVYIGNKKAKASKPNYDHVVQIGESMHSISQKYGMKMRNLYKLN